MFWTEPGAVVFGQKTTIFVRLSGCVVTRIGLLAKDDALDAPYRCTHSGPIPYQCRKPSKIEGSFNSSTLIPFP